MPPICMMRHPCANWWAGMFNPARLRADFNAAASRYNAHAGLQEHVLRQLLQLLGPIPKEARVLDAGCGTGNFSVFTGHRNTVALDSAFSMCKQAQAATPHSINANMSRLPFANASFDVVFSSLALQWAENWQATIAEWLRVLKPKGIIAFSSFAQGTLHELAESFATVDRHPHISHFMNAAELSAYPELHHKEETVTEYYPSVTALAKHLKALGARNKTTHQRRSLMTPRQMEAVERYYASHFGTPEGLRVSWNLLYAIGQKP